MKLCYLILAHNTPNHLGRLIEVLTERGAQVFIHLDKKSPLAEFDSISKEEVQFIEQRVSVCWGGFSVVQATLNLIEAALASGKAFDYCALLSGSDYPLRTQDAIEQYLEEKRGTEFINCVRLPNHEVNKTLERIQSYRVETDKLQPYVGSHLLAQKLAATVNRLPIKRDHTKAFGDMVPHGGSQWWVLSRDAIAYIHSFCQSHPAFMKYFQNVAIPDEFFFQTVLANSPFADKLTRNLTFADFSRPQPPYPAIIDKDHLDQFATEGPLLDNTYGQGPALFARKFPDRSQDLVQRVQQEIW